jgi:hypothetical protein
MKKLKKLRIGQMQDYDIIDPKKQMNMKGGTFIKLYPIYSPLWNVVKSVYSQIYGSNNSPSTASGSCPTGSTFIYESDSTKIGDGTIIYGYKVICIPPN